MKNVVTEVQLDTNQIKFLIDLMWSTPLNTMKTTADRHDVDDVFLESHLEMCLGSALAELD